MPSDWPRAGVHVYLGSSDEVAVDSLRQAIGFVLGNVSLRRSLAAQSRRLVDGLGARRFAVALAGASLAVRRATADDSRLLFDGRNAESVRRASLSPSLSAGKRISLAGRESAQPPGACC